MSCRHDRGVIGRGDSMAGIILLVLLMLAIGIIWWSQLISVGGVKKTSVKESVPSRKDVSVVTRDLYSVEEIFEMLRNVPGWGSQGKIKRVLKQLRGEYNTVVVHEGLVRKYYLHHSDLQRLLEDIKSGRIEKHVRFYLKKER